MGRQTTGALKKSTVARIISEFECGRLNSAEIHWERWILLSLDRLGEHVKGIVDEDFRMEGEECRDQERLLM